VRRLIGRPLDVGPTDFDAPALARRDRKGLARRFRDDLDLDKIIAS